MGTFHAALWLDHHEAKIFHLTEKSYETQTLEAAHKHVKRHPTVTAEHEHPADAKRYYHDVAVALSGSHEILVVGPGQAKLEFIKHVHGHDAPLVPRIVGVETVDHPTDGQIVAYARKYFRAADALR